MWLGLRRWILGNCNIVEVFIPLSAFFLLLSAWHSHNGLTIGITTRQRDVELGEAENRDQPGSVKLVIRYWIRQEIQGKACKESSSFLYFKSFISLWSNTWSFRWPLSDPHSVPDLSGWSVYTCVYYDPPEVTYSHLLYLSISELSLWTLLEFRVLGKGFLFFSRPKSIHQQRNNARLHEWERHTPVQQWRRWRK